MEWEMNGGSVQWFACRDEHVRDRMVKKNTSVLTLKVCFCLRDSLESLHSINNYGCEN